MNFTKSEDHRSDCTSVYDIFHCGFSEGLCTCGATNDALRSKLSHAQCLITKAQDILARYLPPDGINQDQAISELLSLLDGPEARAALGDKQCSG